MSRNVQTLRNNSVCFRLISSWPFGHYTFLRDMKTMVNRVRQLASWYSQGDAWYLRASCWLWAMSWWEQWRMQFGNHFGNHVGSEYSKVMYHKWRPTDASTMSLVYDQSVWLGRTYFWVTCVIDQLFHTLESGWSFWCRRDIFWQLLESIYFSEMSRTIFLFRRSTFPAKFFWG